MQLKVTTIITTKRQSGQFAKRREKITFFVVSCIDDNWLENARKREDKYETIGKNANQKNRTLAKLKQLMNRKHDNKAIDKWL